MISAFSQLKNAAAQLMKDAVLKISHSSLLPSSFLPWVLAQGQKLGDSLRDDVGLVRGFSRTHVGDQKVAIICAIE